jgi:hypothetical protein
MVLLLSLISSIISSRLVMGILSPGLTKPEIKITSHVQKGFRYRELNPGHLGESQVS